MGERVVLFVEQPNKSDGRDEYSCRIGLEGGGLAVSTRIYGIDPMQALVLSVGHLNSFVTRHSKAMHPNRLVWEFAANETDFGFPDRL